jgi:threonine/homoserine/homoserine lactone efflux protein
MTLFSLIAFAAALIADSISPGPTVAALIARVLSRGIRNVAPFLIAIWLGEALWLTAAIAGLASIAAVFSRLFEILKWMGVAYLVYLAWTLFTSKPAREGGVVETQSHAFATFLSGLSVSIGNPKNMLFYLSFLPSILDMRAVNLTGWMQLVATLLATLIAVDLCWVLAAEKARRWLQNSRAVRRIHQISGGAMAIAATAIAMR